MKTIIFSALLAFSAAQISCNNNVPHSHSSAADMIPVDSANKMISSYLNSIDSAQTISLVFDAESLRDYLKDPQITGLKFMLAHPLDYINEGNEDVNGGLQAGKLTIVVGGFDKAGNYVYAPGHKVANKAKICPPFCNASGSAANNLFE